MRLMTRRALAISPYRARGEESCQGHLRSWAIYYKSCLYCESKNAKVRREVARRVVAGARRRKRRDGERRWRRRREGAGVCE